MSLSSITAPASDKANPPSTVSFKADAADVNKQSSGESSDAGKWFESTNNNAKQNSASFVDSMSRRSGGAVDPWLHAYIVLQTNPPSSSVTPPRPKPLPMATPLVAGAIPLRAPSPTARVLCVWAQMAAAPKSFGV
jgi:hypothetical protein